MEIHNPILESHNIRLHLIDNRKAIKVLSNRWTYCNRIYQFMPIHLITIGYLATIIPDFEILINKMRNSVFMDVKSESDSDEYCWDIMRSVINDELINPTHTIHLTIIANASNRWYKKIKAFHIPQ